jgi:CRISPR/Cas system CMR-associated protein Cmr5 small subunit
MLNQQLAAINQRDIDSAQMLTDAKEMYAFIEAHASAIIKQEEDLTTGTRVIDQWEHVVEELE